MKAVSGGAISGDVHVIVSKADGEVTKEMKFSNIIIDVGYEEWLKRLCSTGLIKNTSPFGLVTNLYLGTGTTEPTPADTGLESRSGTLAGKANQGGTFDSDKYLATAVGNVIDNDNEYYETWYTLRFIYGEGEAEGVWTELGLSDDNYSHPFSRALFRDEAGNAQSLTILSDEYLSVFYTVSFISEPLDAGSVTVNGVASSVRMYPGVDVTNSLNNYDLRHSYLAADTRGSLSDMSVFGIANLKPDDSTVVANGGGYNGSFYGGFTYIGGLAASGDFVFDPSDADEEIGALMPSTGDQGGLFCYLVFTPAIQKRANYRVTISVDLDLSPAGPSVSGLADAASSTTLDFTWDAYPGATEYQLTLRQAGTVIEEQTVTAESASFTGLTASTEYHLDIKPIATPRNGRRLIHAASTTA